MARHGELAALTVEVTDVSSSRWGELALLTVESYGDPVLLNALADQTVQPGATITITASLTTGTPDTWAWTQTAGPTTDFTGDGTDTISLVAPATTTGTALTFKVTATRYGTTVADDCVITIRPQQWWRFVAGAPVPIVPQVP